MNVSLKRREIFVVLLCLMLFFTSCSRTSSPNANNADTKYYTGYKGVEMKLEEAMPPSRLYYYGDSNDNTFNVNVEVSNQGTSWSRGAIFVSGYDPNLIQIQGIIPDRSNSRACKLNIGNIGFGTFGGSIVCDNFFAKAGKDILEVGLKNVFCPGGQYADKNNFIISRLTGKDSCNSATLKRIDGTTSAQINFGNPDIDIEYANHGRLLIAVLQALDFDRVFGQEYLLAGNTYEYPGGEVKYMSFDGNVVQWPAGLDKTDQTFLITNCFMYATYAAPIVCIDPSPFSDNKKVCTPKSYSGTSGQGAPVAVTSIEQENTPRQAIFTIHIKNSGGGRVYDPGYLEICSPYSPTRITNNELNKVYIGDIRVSGDLQRLTCTPDDFVRLDPKTGTGVITCAYDIPYGGLKSAYQAPLVVELWYGYEKTIQKTVQIKRAI